MPPTVISAYSKRQVMDWSLVLASQDIPSTIVQTEPTGWGLLVEPQDYERALSSIQQYRLENRRWGWRQPLPWSEATFHWGALGWCTFLVVMHWLSVTDLQSFRSTGAFKTDLVAHGEWWRTFSAMLLHANLSHLLANTTIGLVLFGLAMARYGAGLGLLAAYLAGAAGNLAGLALYPTAYTGLGASGMVMGALGLISVPAGRHWLRHPRAFRQFTQAIFAGLFLFLLWGVNPASDVIAHTGGFVSGALLAAGLGRVSVQGLQGRVVQAVSWIIFLGLLALTTWLALTRS
jgi:membrane associated rhomboid family serine protease